MGIPMAYPQTNSAPPTYMLPQAIPEPSSFPHPPQLCHIAVSEPNPGYGGGHVLSGMEHERPPSPTQYSLNPYSPAPPSSSATLLSSQMQPLNSSNQHMGNASPGLINSNNVYPIPISPGSMLSPVPPTSLALMTGPSGNVSPGEGNMSGGSPGDMVGLESPGGSSTVASWSTLTTHQPPTNPSPAYNPASFINPQHRPQPFYSWY